MISHLTKLAFSPNDDLTKVEVISNVEEGVDEGTSFGYEPSYDKIGVENSQHLVFKAMHELTVIGLNTSNVSEANLLALNSGDQKAKIAAIGIDGALVSLADQRVEFLDKFDTGNFFRFFVKAASIPYHDRVDGRKGAGIHVGENLLSMYSWADADSDGVANGVTAAGFFSEAFAAGVQTLVKNDATGGATYKFPKMFFPFVGEELTFSVTVDAYTNGGHQPLVKIEFFDNTGASLSSQTSNFTTTGRKNVVATIPSGAVEFQASVEVADNLATSPSTLEISDPAVRVDGKTVFTAY